MTSSDVSVVFVSYNTINMIGAALEALFLALDNVESQIIVVDNCSRDGSADYLRENYPQVQLIQNKFNVGFGRANNQVVGFLHGQYVLLLNTDAFIEPSAILKTIAYMDKNLDCGVLGVRLVGRDGDLQPSCRYFPTPLNVFVARTGLGRFFPWLKMVDDMSWDHASVRECDWLPGCYYLIRREVIDQVGLFDPRYFLYYEEVDHCKRVKQAGWKVVYYPHTTVVHIGGESAKSVGELNAASRQISTLQIESELLYFRKHHGLLGLAAHMLLVSLGDLILALKALLKGRGWAVMGTCWQHARVTWALLRDTKFASQPTR
jgi:N-acetylglucosaminyl-diphospho-decaprenol L-rhamnosyltransferase